MVVDGLGGQAAGGKAADTALAVLRRQLERRAGPVVERIREAITNANNEIHWLAGTRPEWQGMACVLTVAVIENGRAVIGHVGDTRLYKLRSDGIEKITQDHSPVGEREDAGELSEADAMRHPRRNEVYRDVGSEPHNAHDPEFIDIYEIPVEPDAALLICSDGLTDMVSLAAIGQIVARAAGDARHVVQALVDAANAAGGKDNVSCVYVERDQFARQVRGPEPGRPRAFRDLLAGTIPDGPCRNGRNVRASPSRPMVAIEGPQLPVTLSDGVVVVRPGGSIAAAIAEAAAGTDVIVEPGEYRERLVLRNGIRVVSRIPRAATIRLPGGASGKRSGRGGHWTMTAELSGFRIVGDAATPLGTGIVVRDAAVSIVNCEISGAARTALDLGGRHAVVIGSDIRDNPGTALEIRSGAAPRVTHNVFSRNGQASRAGSSVIVERGANPVVSGNIFEGAAPLTAPDEAVRGQIQQNNWFVASRQSESPTATNGRDR